MKKQIKITIPGGYIRTKMDPEELQEHFKARNSGCGWHGSKKDYKRREKHNKKYY